MKMTLVAPCGAGKRFFARKEVYELLAFSLFCSLVATWRAAAGTIFWLPWTLCTVGVVGTLFAQFYPKR